MVTKNDGGYVPGPGHYEIGVGFSKINDQMVKAQELRQSGMDINVLNNTNSFKGLNDRFKDPSLDRKA